MDFNNLHIDFKNSNYLFIQKRKWKNLNYTV